MDIKQQCEQYLKYKYEYYIIGESSVSDYEFDVFEQDLIKTNNTLALQVSDLVDFPSLETIKTLGLDIKNIAPSYKLTRNKKKYKHLTKMLSIQKLKVEDEENLPYKELKTFLDRLPSEEYELSPKMDGNAISLTYEYIDGVHKLDSALTRGNGEVGLSKIEKLKLIVPTTLKYNTKSKILIRGEIVIERSLWRKKYSDPNKIDNERNFVAGQLNRDDFDYNEITDLTFVAFDFKIIEDNKIKVVDDTMKELLKLGFNSNYQPLIMTIKTEKDFDDFYFKYKKYRETCHFLLDGIVIKYKESLRNKLGDNGKYPKSMLAIKFKPKAVITKILGYEFTLGKDGELTPIIYLSPIELDGSMVQRASGSNLGKILEKGLYPGSWVELVKFGDIIPGIVRVTKESPMKKEYEEYVKEFIKNHS